MVSQSCLKELYDYRDGKFFWRIKPCNWINIGDEAGSRRTDGYYVIRIKGISYLLHRLIYLFHHGFIPDLIDHIDQNPSNNKIENLRPSDKKKNAYNTGLYSHNKSGVRGVSWCSKQKKWTVRFKHDDKYLFGGYFTDIEQAREKRQELERRYL